VRLSLFENVVEMFVCPWLEMLSLLKDVYLCMQASTKASRHTHNVCLHLSVFVSFVVMSLYLGFVLFCPRLQFNRKNRRASPVYTETRRPLCILMGLSRYSQFVLRSF
jgi:hypothetical protein